MDQQQSIIYALCGAAGALAGLTRFLSSNKRWSCRAIWSFSLIGVVTSIALVGYTYGGQVEENPWKAIAISLAVGFIQPQSAGILLSIVQGLVPPKGSGDEKR